MENRVKKFAKEARMRLLKNNYSEEPIKKPSGRVFKLPPETIKDSFYEMVCNMAKQDFVLNPIGKLIEHENICISDGTENIKEVFRITKKYLSCLERYRKESSLENLTLASRFN